LLIPLAVLVALFGSAGGLLLSFHASLPAGAAIILTLGGLYVISLVVGPAGLLARWLKPRWHYAA
jgi:zinc/manganese transport system permease protein